MREGGGGGSESPAATCSVRYNEYLKQTFLKKAKRQTFSLPCPLICLAVTPVHRSWPWCTAARSGLGGELGGRCGS